MAPQMRDDILVSRDPAPTGRRPLRSQIAAFVPITIALVGIAAILAGGMPASKSSLAANETIDPVTTGSIAR